MFDTKSATTATAAAIVVTKPEDDHEWARTLGVLLGADVPLQKVYHDGNDLVVLVNQTEASKFKQRYLERLQSAATLNAHLPYTLQTAGDVKHVGNDDKKDEHGIKSKAPLQLPTKLPQDTVAEGMRIFWNVFQNILKELDLALQLVYLNKTARSENRVLYSKIPLSHPDILAARQRQYAILKSCLEQIDSARLCKAVLNPEQGGEPLPVPPAGAQPQNRLAKLAEKILYITPQGQLCFDYGLMCQLAMQPVLRDKVLGGDVEFRFDARHLTAYATQLCGNSALLELTEAGKATPLTFSLSGVPKPQYVKLAIDRSGSMTGTDDENDQGTFIPFKADCQAYVDFLSEYKPVIGLTLFNHKTDSYTDMGPEQYAALKATINAAKADGGTRLYGTIVDCLNDIYHRRLTEHHIVTLILLTDGYDTATQNHQQNPKNPPPEITLDHVKAAMQQFNQHSAPPRPQVFTCGVGKFDLVLRDIATAMAGKHVDMKSTDDFLKIKQDIARMTCPSDVFMMKHCTGQSETVRVFANNKPQVLRVQTMGAEKSGGAGSQAQFTMDGFNYVVQAKPPVAAATAAASTSAKRDSVSAAAYGQLGSGALMGGSGGSGSGGAGKATTAAAAAAPPAGAPPKDKSTVTPTSVDCCVM